MEYKITIERIEPAKVENGYPNRANVFEQTVDTDNGDNLVVNVIKAVNNLE